MGSSPAIDQFKNVKAIVFDLDDTIYLQADYKKSGFNAVAKMLSTERSLDFEVILNTLNRIMDEHGPSNPYMFNKLCEKFNLPDKYIKQSIDVFIHHDLQISCFPHVKSVLTKLRVKYKLGLLTDGRVLSQQKKVEALGIANQFDQILYSDSLGLEKPAFQLYEYFEKCFSLPPYSLCYIGDNPRKDFITANARGWKTIRVLTGEFAKMQCGKNSLPTLAFQNVHETLKIFLTD